MRKLAIPILLVAILALQGTSEAQQATSAGKVQDIDITLYDVVQGTNGTFSLKPVRIVITGASIPDPVDPDDPPIVTDWKKTAKEAIDLVPDYADRGKHIKALAFSLNMIGSTIGGSTKPPGDAVAQIKAFGAAIPGADADKWGPFWAKLDPLLNAAKTNADLGAGLVAVKDVLELELSDADVSGNEMYGSFPTYGLQEDGSAWIELIMKLLPLILQLIEALRS